MPTTYEPGSYWDQIYEGGYDESAVGYPNLAVSLNRARYEVELRNVERALRTAAVPSPRRVLDVGSGTGIWIDFWTRRGAHQVFGADLTEAAVQRLRERYPHAEFLQADIGEPDVPLPRTMDVVSAMSVLLHIVDEQRFERALENLMASLRPGGSLILVEPLIVHRWWGPPFGAHSNSRARPLSEYQRILASRGFTIVELRPALCLLANVMDTRSPLAYRALFTYWDLLSRAVGRRELPGRIAGSVLRPLDLALTALLPNGPSAKVIVARQTDADALG
jgi:SAM-dependent methyltransferase